VLRAAVVLVPESGVKEAQDGANGQAEGTHTSARADASGRQGPGSAVPSLPAVRRLALQAMRTRGVVGVAVGPTWAHERDVMASDAIAREVLAALVFCPRHGEDLVSGVCARCAA